MIKLDAVRYYSSKKGKWETIDTEFWVNPELITFLWRFISSGQKWDLALDKAGVNSLLTLSEDTPYSLEYSSKEVAVKQSVQEILLMIEQGSKAVTT